MPPLDAMLQAIAQMLVQQQAQDRAHHRELAKFHDVSETDLRGIKGERDGGAGGQTWKGIARPSTYMGAAHLSGDACNEPSQREGRSNQGLG